MGLAVPVRFLIFGVACFLGSEQQASKVYISHPTARIGNPAAHE